MKNKHTYTVSPDNKKVFIDDIPFNVHFSKEDSELHPHRVTINIYNEITQKFVVPLVYIFFKRIRTKTTKLYPIFLKDEAGYLSCFQDYEFKTQEDLNKHILEWIENRVVRYYNNEKDKSFLKELEIAI